MSTTISLNREERSSFPTLLNEFERGLLDHRSTESGLSKSAVLRQLLLKEVASRELSRHEPRESVKLKG